MSSDGPGKDKDCDKDSDEDEARTPGSGDEAASYFRRVRPRQAEDDPANKMAPADREYASAEPSVRNETMWPFRQTKRYNWKKEQGRLWRELVPADGQADTLQGELIRIAGKLTDQAYRNGNMNWDSDHERMWRFIGETIADDPVFSSADQTLIRAKVEEIIRDEECPDLSGDASPYYIVAEKVVDWCMAHPDPIPHQKDPNLKR